MTDTKHEPSTADHVGEAAGGLTGAVAGAAIGSSAGPVGVLLGGIAGAIGGWWSGRALAEAAEDITEAEEQYYRADFERRRTPRHGYESAMGAYYLGDVASANPDYAGRTFADIEPELASAWNATATAHGDWQAMRGYTLVGFDRGRERRRKPR